MGHWDNRRPAKDDLRLFVKDLGWVRYGDEVDPADPEKIREQGCSKTLESFLINALNSANLLLLTGAGASFCAKNADAQKPNAPGLQDLWTAVKAEAGDETFNSILAKIPNGRSIKNIEKLLTHCKLFVELYGSDAGDGKAVSDFVASAEKAILARVDFVDDKTELDSHEMILRKLARRGLRKSRAKIFSTNYDLCFEYAARRLRFVVVDGFSHAAPQVYDRSHFGLDIVRREGETEAPNYLESVFHLYKLHGSLDWRRTSVDVVRGRGAEGRPVLIYPRDSKYQEAFEPPYLDMMGALQAAIRQPDTTLIVCGLSFADSHIAQPILAALESNMSFKLVLCDPVFIDDVLFNGDPVKIAKSDVKLNDFQQRILHLASTGDQRLAVLNGRFEDLAIALPDLVSITERERHADRVRALREAPVTNNQVQVG